MRAENVFLLQEDLEDLEERVSTVELMQLRINLLLVA